jgi:hypothetical protein
MDTIFHRKPDDTGTLCRLEQVQAHRKLGLAKSIVVSSTPWIHLSPVLGHCPLASPNTWVISWLGVAYGHCSAPGLRTGSVVRCRQERAGRVNDSAPWYSALGGKKTIAHRPTNPSVTLYCSVATARWCGYKRGRCRVSTGAKVRECGAASPLHGPRQEGLVMLPVICFEWEFIYYTVRP